MRLFACRVCGAMLYFENTRCETCGHRLGFDPARLTLATLEPTGQAWNDPVGTWRFCANAAHQACNWLIPAAGTDILCRACRHNRLIPDLSVPANLPLWQTLEAAKHRLIYALIRLQLPLATRAEHPHGLTFDFPADLPGQPVTTGHDQGTITIALKEADPGERTRTRLEMGELYRTPLGHFRHEIAHHYWDLLIRDAVDNGARLAAFRALFGDERQDYAGALTAHYNRPDTGAWRAGHISLYASSHPWEDFAETWAHFLHIIDTLDVARDFGLVIHPQSNPLLAAQIDFDPYEAVNITQLINAWLPLAFAVNSLNRAMGQPDLYPFVLSPPVIRKLAFVQSLMPQPSTA